MPNTTSQAETIVQVIEDACAICTTEKQIMDFCRQRLTDEDFEVFERFAAIVKQSTAHPQAA